MPVGAAWPDPRRVYLRSVRDPREREIEWARLYRMRSPLTFAERKARRLAAMPGRRSN